MLEYYIVVLLISSVTVFSGSDDPRKHIYQKPGNTAQYVILNCPSEILQRPTSRTSCKNLQETIANIGFIEQRKAVNLRKVREEKGAGAACIIDLTYDHNDTEQLDDFYCHGKDAYERNVLKEKIHALLVEPDVVIEISTISNPKEDSVPTITKKVPGVFIELTTKEPSSALPEQTR